MSVDDRDEIIRKLHEIVDRYDLICAVVVNALETATRRLEATGDEQGLKDVSAVMDEHGLAELSKAATA